MSKQLAIASSLSVLMMSIYVLFGTDAAQRPLTSADLAKPASSTASGLADSPERLLPIMR